MRFQFGKNWKNFLSLIDDQKILQAEKSLKEMLGVENLKGKYFLDVGSGSGLFSLAARNLGAVVRSFDYDDDSVHCSELLKEKYRKGDDKWIISHGSILDKNFLSKIGDYDIVYSWGVLHHTGQMWEAFQNVIPLLKKNGLLFISIYNDQRFVSKYWLVVKKTYNKFWITRPLFVLMSLLYPILPSIILKKILRRKIPRAMNFWYDLIDWLGGYPFEVSSPDKIFQFYKDRNLLLEKMVTVGGRSGCNEFIFKKN